MSSRFLPVAVATIVLVVASHVYSQTEASVNGVVIDDTKAVSPGVTVTVTDLDTGRQFVSVTDDSTFGQPRQVLNVAYMPRAQQLAFKISF